VSFPRPPFSSVVFGLLTLVPLAARAQCRYWPAPTAVPPCEVVSDVDVASTGTASLRVLSYNVHFGADVDGLARALDTNPRTHDADVLLLQEIESYPDDRRPEKLARRLHRYAVYAPARTKGNGTHGLAILSRRPLRDVEVLALPQFELGWGTRQRVALSATMDWNGADVRIVDVHLDTRLTPDQRFRQIAPALDRAAAYPRVVVGGDMNTISCLTALLPGIPILMPGTSQGPAFDAFMAAQGYHTPFHRIGGTGPLHQRLDGIFTRGLGVSGFDKEDTVNASDHVPIWAEIALPHSDLVSAPAAAPSYRPTF
jgi:endonuclease/exonuclease/phosphatase family metal-dependent hydrolase